MTRACNESPKSRFYLIHDIGFKIRFSPDNLKKKEKRKNVIWKKKVMIRTSDAFLLPPVIAPSAVSIMQLQLRRTKNLVYFESS